LAGGGSAQGGLGQLALAGTGAANGSGSFAVSPGMSVTDTRGRVIGTVQNVATNAHGTVQSVTVAAGKRLATLPAADFSGSGNVLTSAMTKLHIYRYASQQANSGG
jgi:sporulation protein YlmC with PRC-barrel domain